MYFAKAKEVKAQKGAIRREDNPVNQGPHNGAGEVVYGILLPYLLWADMEFPYDGHWSSRIDICGSSPAVSEAQESL